MRWYKAWMVVFSCLFVLAACAPNTAEPMAEQNVRDENVVDGTFESTAGSFPVTVVWDGNEVTLDAKPERITALSLDTADAVLELTDASNVIAVADSITNPYLAFRVEEGNQVPHKLRFSDAQDPEKILAHDPDLILLTRQHAGEMDAENMLMQSGIPLISFDPWNTLYQIERNVMVIGKLIGEEKKADELVESMRAKANDVQDAVKDIEKPLSVLVISPVGTNTGPFLLGTNSLATELLRAAGAMNAAELMGLDKSTPASVEQVIKADPDFILLTDWDGEGETVFEELMKAPGWNTLQAVQNNRMKMIDAKYIVTPNLHAAEGVEKIARWLYPERFSGGKGQ